MSLLNLSARSLPITIYGYDIGGSWSDTSGASGDFDSLVDVIRLGSGADRVEYMQPAHGMTIFGNGGADTLLGSAFGDSLDGGADADLLISEGGDDTLTGGGGNDVFRITGFLPQGSYTTQDSARTVTITDFQSGDRLDLSHLPVTSLADLALFTSNAGGALVLSFFVNDYLQTIRLNGVSALAAADVILATSTSPVYGYGTGGRDDLFGANGGDQIDAGAGDDRVLAAGGNDVVYGMEGNDSLYGGAGSDTIVAGADDDRVEGGDGNDFIEGEDGADSLNGGDGNDTLFGESATQPDALWNDTLSGGAGNDLLAGGAGEDQLTGGSGADTFRIHAQQYSNAQLTADTRDTVTDFSAEDRIDVSTAGISDITTLRYLLESQGSTGMMLTIWNNGYRTELALNGSVSDPQSLGAGNVVLSNVTQNDYVYGTEARDDLFGGRGDDILSGGGDDDRLFGESGNDNADGGAGNDLLFGGDGSDTITASFGNDSVDGGAGRDQITGGEGTDSLAGGADDDLIRGDDEDTNWQQAFTDTLEGGAGADTLAGGAGDDRLTGGAGSDAFRLSFGAYWAYSGLSLAADTTDVAVDFNATEDRIDFSEARISDLETARMLLVDNAGGTASSVVVWQNGYRTILSLGTLFRPEDLTAARAVLSVDTTADLIQGSEARDDFFGGGGDDSISGLGGIDRLFGETGNDWIDGGDGEDALYGGAGSDTVFGGAGADLVQAGAGLDSIEGGAGADTINGGADADTLVGDTAITTWNLIYHDVLTGGAGDDLLAGGAGNDTLTGGEGADAFRLAYSSEGWNTLSADTVDVVTDWTTADKIDVTEAGITEFATVQALLAVSGETTELVSYMNGYRNVLRLLNWTDLAAIGSANVVLAVNDEADYRSGGNQADDFFGGGGDDNLSGGGGRDRLFGEAGNDSLFGGTGADLLSGSGGSDRLEGESGDDTLDGGAGADDLLGGIGRDSLSGGDGDDRLFGDTVTESEEDAFVYTDWALSYDDVLTGGAGADTLAGQGGNDTLTGGAGADMFSMAGNRTASMIEDSIDRITDWTAEDRIDLRELGISDVETVQRLLITENGSISLLVTQNGFLNKLELGAAATVGTLNAGNFLFSTNVSADSITGTRSHDDLFGGRGNDALDGGLGQGRDRLFGEIGNDSLSGGAGADTLYGGAGTDEMEGGDGSDQLYGGAGNDEVSGGAGSDTMYGGAGADRFVMGSWTGFIDSLNDYGRGTSNGGAVIADFSRAEEDLIDLRELGIENFTTLKTYFWKDLGDDGAIDITAYGFTQRITILGFDDLEELGRAAFIFDTSKVAERYTGAIVADIVALGAGDDTASGGGGADQLIGEGGDDSLDGGADADTLDGGSGSDALEGGTGDDSLSGGAGTDTLTGGAGADTLSGGGGADTFELVADEDLVSGGVGRDRVIFEEAAIFDLGDQPAARVGTLAAAVTPRFVSIEIFSGSKKADSMTGDGKANVFQGNGGRDVLSGQGGADRLEGGAGNDRLSGGAGKDVLTGGAGKDVFVFDTALGKTNLDRVTDFNVAADTFELDRSVFRKLKAGDLAAEAFAIGAKAREADDRIIYDSKTGALFYDADGSGKGAAVKFAVLDSGLKLTAADFDVIL